MPGAAPTIPAHRLLRRIGEGSYGTIWLAMNAMGTYRAVKVVYRSHFRDEHPYEREYQGIKNFEPLSRSHDGFVDILQVERNDEAGYFYYVMELADDLVQGQHIDPETYTAKTLAGEREKRSWLPLEECLQLALSLSSALEHLHKNRLVHRDIKASNIVFVNGTPKLADIGLVSEIKADSTFVGTPGFIPPEGPGTPAADIYSLGKVLYEMSTGLHHREFPLVPEGSSGPVQDNAFQEWHTILRKASDDNVNLRYHSAPELQAHLALVRAGKSVKRLLQMERCLVLAKQYGPLAVALLLIIPLVLFQVIREKKHADEDRQRQAGSYLAHGSRDLADGEFLAALPWFVRALRFDQGQPARELTDRVRIGSALQHSSKLIQVRSSSNACLHAEFGPTDDQILSPIDGQRSALWNLSHGQRLSPFFGIGQHDDERSSFSRDFHRVVTYNADPHARVWDAHTGELLGTYGRGGWVVSAQFDPTGQRLITVEDEASEARVWNLTTGQEEELPLLGHTNHLWYATFSPDGRRIVTTSEGGQAIVWDAMTSQLLLTFNRHHAWVYQAAFSPDSKWIATVSGDHTAQIWEADTGREIVAPLQHNDHVRSAQFSPNGQWLVTACLDGKVHIWDVQSGQQALPTLTHNTRVEYAAFSPTGTRVLCVGIDGTLCVWDLRTARPVTLGSTVAFSADGLKRAQLTGKTIVVTRSLDDRSLASIPLSGETPSGMFLDATGTTLLGTLRVQDQSGHWRRRTQVWDILRGPFPTLQLTNGTDWSDLMLSPSGKRLAVRTASHVAIWDVPSGQGPWIIPCPSARHFAFDHSGNRLSAVFEKAVGLWSVPGPMPHLLCTFTNNMKVSHVEFSPDDRLLLTSCADETLSPGLAQLRHVPSGDPAGPPLPHRDGVLYATFSPDGKTIITCSEDFSAVLWATATSQRLPIPSLNHQEQVIFASFSHNGQWVLTIEKSGTVRVWDALTGELVMPPLRHATPLSSAQFIANDSQLATLSVDGTVQLWDLPRDPRPIEELSLIAALLTGQGVDQASPADKRAESQGRGLWNYLTNRYPQDFSVASAKARP
jgi:WD40 repeat protein